MQEVQTILPNGSIVRDRYMIESLLGKGGFGAVYLVHDTRVKGNQFALKEVIDPKKHDRVHFLFEGEVLKQLDHAALPRVYRVFEDEPHSRVYLLMDYIKGPNLERLRRLQPENRFALPDMLRLMTPIVEAVMYLQSQKPPIIHRDIKPANIIVPPNGDVPVLVDFGIAKEYDQEATTTAVRRLSPNYSAPEQYTQGTNPRTDVYGMAATFYTLLTGTPPIDAFERITHMGNHGTDPLEPVSHFVPNIPPPVSEALHRAMALASDERFPTMEAFWQALQPQSFPAPAPVLIAPLPGARSSAPAQPVAMLASAMTSPNVSRQQAQKSRPEKRRMLLPLFTLLALVAMLFGALFGTSFFSRSNPFRSSASAGTATTRQHSASTQTTIPTTPSPATTATVPATASPLATPKPTSAPAYPNVDNQYIGSIHNASANIDGTMTLTNVHQNGPTIGGVLTLTNGLSGTATFTGTVTNSNTLQFQVTPYAQYLPLLFQGRVAPNGSLVGTYCSVQNNQCNYAGGGYGTWKVFPPSSSS
ncbi:MAG: hypothetical protein PVS3B3_31740 [Ktedonobacteraceae bacterium]